MSAILELPELFLLATDGRSCFQSCQIGHTGRSCESSLVQSCFGAELPGRAATFPSGPELPGRLRVGFRAAISCSNLEYSQNGYTNRNFVLFASSLHYFIMMKCSRTDVLEHDYTHKMGRLHARKERLF